MTTRNVVNGLLLSTVSLAFVACSGGGGGEGDDAPAPVVEDPAPAPAPAPDPAPDPDPDPVPLSFQGQDLLDPSPAANNGFGSFAVQLAGGQIAVSASGDATTAAGAGAIHIYNPDTAALIASAFGTEADQQLGRALIALSNGNLISLNGGTFGGLNNAGSVSLLDGDDLLEIATFGGDDADDAFGFGAPFGESAGVVELLGPNAGLFVIHSPFDDVGGNANAGSVVLVDGTTGAEIARIEGDAPDDELGSNGVFALSNGNVVILSSDDNPGGLNDAGSFTLVDGATGAILAQVAGDDVNDGLGREFAELTNGNFIVGSRFDDDAGVNDGSVFLINSANGNLVAEIRGTDVGATDIGGDVLALDNGNFVVGASGSDSGGFINRGFIGLFDGDTGALIASTVGDDDGDQFGIFLLGLSGGRYMASNIADNIGGEPAVGSASFFDSAGNELARITGDDAQDEFGGNIRDQLLLANGNVAILSEKDDIGGVVDAGSVTLIDGTNFTEITRIEFDNDLDLDDADIFGLPNGNLVIAAGDDTVNGVSEAGSMTLVDGVDGSIIVQLAGTVPGEFGIVFALPIDDDHFVLVTPFETIDGASGAGSARVIDAATGEVVAQFSGDNENDFFPAAFDSLEGGGFVAGSEFDDVNGLVDAGSAILVTLQPSAP
ncbi:MAG: hypothetical protein AAFR65_06280 [Pseudomonadota bacterium]